MRLVIKIGTSTLAYPTGRLNIRRISSFCRVVSDLKNAGNEIVIVSSGAIAMGVGKLGLNARPKDIPTKQAAAAVGQCELMYVYDREFTEYNHTVAQILLTADDIQVERRLNNFRNTVERLLELGAIPIINENDTVETAEIVIGDNDTLGAVVSTAIDADLLVLLSDIDGLYTKDPHRFADAELIREVRKLDDSIVSMGGGAGSEMGTGGMATKLRAAKICTEAGCDMIIANGQAPDALYGIIEEKPVGTRFFAEKKEKSK